MADTVARARTRGQAREEAILAATFELLGEVGYERLTTDAIASRARSSKTTIYKRWTGKADLVVAALRHGEPIAVESTDTGSLRGDLLTLLHLLRKKFTGPNLPRMNSMLHAISTDPDLAAAFRSYLLPHRAGMAAEIVRRARKRDEVPVDADPAVILDIIPGVLLTRIVFTGEPVGDDYLAHVVDDLLVPLLSAGTR